MAAHTMLAMTNSNSYCAKVSPFLLSVMRIAIGLLFMSHGCQKLLGYPPGGQKVELHLTLMALAAVLELVGGALIVLGLLTRPTAFILSGEMAVAYFKAHASNGLGFWPVQNHGELAVLYCFVFFYLAAAGAGPFSVDALRKKG
jgi:putative oxidoreductase